MTGVAAGDTCGRMNPVPPLVFVVPLALAVACSAAGSSDGDGAPGSGGTTGSAGVAGAGGNAGTGATNGFDASAGGSGGEAVGTVYGHSARTLYELEPFSKTVTRVADFDCAAAVNVDGGSGMWDIAVDRDGNMVGVLAVGINQAELVRIDVATGACETITTGRLPNSLTYVPAGTIEPDREVLVGYDRSRYIRIDPDTGDTSEIGSLNPGAGGKLWESSGDIVSIINGPTLVTVKPALSGNDAPSDHIVSVDPVTGRVTAIIGDTGQPRLWGLGFWAGTAWGFSENGSLVEIDLAVGAGSVVPIGGDTAELSFWGAGTTTAAPVEPPR